MAIAASIYKAKSQRGTSQKATTTRKTTTASNAGANARNFGTSPLKPAFHRLCDPATGSTRCGPFPCQSHCCTLPLPSPTPTSP